MTVEVDDEMARAKVGDGPLGFMRLSRARAAVVECIKNDTEHLIPMGDPKYVRPSGKIRKKVNTLFARSGEISWTSPAAAKVYRMPAKYKFFTPGTGPQWVERAKATNMEKWRNAAKEELDG